MQHRCQTKEVTDGFGHPAGFGENETYAMITFTRLAWINFISDKINYNPSA